jgi:hypothetical protein
LIRAYPPFPAPERDFENDYTEKALSSFLARFVPLRNILEITFDGIDAFVKDKPSVPKVVLFTDKKKGVPTLFKALANNLEGKMFFAVARKEEDSDLAKKYDITNYPTIIMIKATEKKH